MKYRKFIIATLIAALMSLLIFQPSLADVGLSSSPTHKVFINAHGIFEIKRIHNLCVPYTYLATPPTGSYVRVIKELECEGLPYGLKKVTTTVGTGWMWDFALEELSDEEKAMIGEEQIPMKDEENV